MEYIRLYLLLLLLLLQALFVIIITVYITTTVTYLRVRIVIAMLNIYTAHIYDIHNSNIGHASYRITLVYVNMCIDINLMPLPITSFLINNNVFQPSPDFLLISLNLPLVLP